MKQKIDTIEQFQNYILTNYSSHYRTFKIILEELPKLSCLQELLDEHFTMDDIAFAIKRNIKLEHHYCPVCGNEIHVYCKNRYPNTCSVRCGNINSQELRKKNSLERYGVENPKQVQAVKDKYKQTMIERYGGYTFQSKELLAKVSKTNLKRYGVEVSGSNKELHKKNIETCLKKYGVTHTSKLKENRAKAKATNLKLHGSENYNNKEKIKQTCLERYGVENPTQCHDIRIKEQSKYLYNDINFDSSWELAFYIWNIDNSIKVEYQPNVFFKYEYNRKIHTYHPDFLINGKLYEIKGDQYFNESHTTMICPYNHNLDGLYSAKYNCMIQNCIIILTSKEIKPYLEYIYENYGIKYLQTFKRK